MADRQPTPEEIHYGRVVYESDHLVAWGALSPCVQRTYCAMAAAARSAPVYVKPAEYLYSSLLDAVVAQSERTSPREDRAIVSGVAKWLLDSHQALDLSSVSDLANLARERAK